MRDSTDFKISGTIHFPSCIHIYYEGEGGRFSKPETKRFRKFHYHHPADISSPMAWISFLEASLQRYNESIHFAMPYTLAFNSMLSETFYLPCLRISESN